MSKDQFLKENLKPGEIYVGIILDSGGDYHLILLPCEANRVDWEYACAWAKVQGGGLPTRREQSLLFANAKENFKTYWYWSGNQHAANSDYVWVQYFVNGSQINITKSLKGRARAVRRIYLEQEK